VSEELELSGAIAPPLANGELLFEAPWQGRVFGMARALADQGAFTWDDFRAELIAVIGAWDAQAEDASVYYYYDRFLQALEVLLVKRGMLAEGELRAQVDALEARPHGHDH
jgi:nitrile hydratase accessory protein